MPRRKYIDRPVQKTLNLPESLVSLVDLALYSKLENRVPFGAWSSYIIELIKKDEARLKLVIAAMVEKPEERKS